MRGTGRLGRSRVRGGRGLRRIRLRSLGRPEGYSPEEGLPTLVGTVPHERDNFSTSCSLRHPPSPWLCAGVRFAPLSARLRSFRLLVCQRLFRYRTMLQFVLHQPLRQQPISELIPQALATLLIEFVGPEGHPFIQVVITDP